MKIVLYQVRKNRRVDLLVERTVLTIHLTPVLFYSDHGETALNLLLKFGDCGLDLVGFCHYGRKFLGNFVRCSLKFSIKFGPGSGVLLLEVVKGFFLSIF